MSARLLALALAATSTTVSAFSVRTPVAPVRRPALKTQVAPAPCMITGLEGPALISSLHTILALNFMPLGPTAFGLGMGGKKMSAGQAKWGERTFMNMIEQAPLFHSSLWIFSAFVDASIGTGLGALYLGFRLLYPIIWAIFGGEDGVPTDKYSVVPPFGPFKQIYYSTFPQYGIIFYMALATVLKLAFGFSLNGLVKMPLLVAPIGFGYVLYHYAYVLFPILHEKIFSKCFAKA